MPIQDYLYSTFLCFFCVALFAAFLICSFFTDKRHMRLMALWFLGYFISEVIRIVLEVYQVPHSEFADRIFEIVGSFYMTVCYFLIVWDLSDQPLKTTEKRFLGCVILASLISGVLRSPYFYLFALPVFAWAPWKLFPLKKANRTMAAAFWCTLGLVVLKVCDLILSVFYPQDYSSLALSVSTELILYTSFIIGMAELISLVRRGRAAPPRSLFAVPDGELVIIRLAEKYNLSPREQAVLKLVMKGENNQKIAEALFIAEGTVKAHLHNIYQKLGVSNRTELLTFWAQSF